jgi:hypothetical protein
MSVSDCLFPNFTLEVSHLGLERLRSPLDVAIGPELGPLSLRLTTYATGQARPGLASVDKEAKSVMSNST